MTITKEQYKELYRKLPSEVRLVIASEELSEEIDRISNKNNLNDEQDSSLASLVGEILVGARSEDNLTKDLKEILEISDNKVKDVVLDVKNNITKNINALYERIISNIEKEESYLDPIEFDSDNFKNNLFIKNFSDQTKERINEISLKYGLNDNQIEGLSKLISATSSAPENFESLKMKISNNIEVSKMLAEQIVGDLEKRIFVNNQIIDNVAVVPKKIVGINEKPLEIRSENLPVKESQNIVSVPKFMPAGLSPKIAVTETPVQKREAQYFTTSPSVQSAATSQNPMNSSPVSRINFGKTETVPVPTPTLEPAQKPAFTPKFGNTSFNDPLSAQQSQSAPQSIIDNKLNNMTGSQIEKPKPQAPVHEYVVDPYREPLA